MASHVRNNAYVISSAREAAGRLVRETGRRREGAWLLIHSIEARPVKPA